SRFGVVCGDVGVGKSALLRAFGAAAREQHPEIRVLAASTGRTPNVPFSLFRKLLLSAADNPTTNIANTITLWISVNLATHSTSVSPEKVNDILRLAGLMDVSAEMAAHPQVWRGRVFGDLGDLMASLSARGGLLLLVDDLEGIDAGSRELLQYLIQELNSFPFGVLGFDRRLDGDPDIETVHHLEPLDEMQSGLFLHNLMKEREVSSEDMRSILDRACGNPLFLEELAELVCSEKSLFEDSLPESLHALLRVQFDHLSVSHRHVLKMASIVGNPFWAGAVAAQLGVDPSRCAVSLESLQTSGLIARENLSQYSDEEQWCFVRPLLREVAYESALKSDRKNGHQVVARWLDTRKSVTPMQHWTLLANQEQQAGNLEKAAQNWRRAGEEARRRHAVGQAKQAFVAALALNCGLTPEERDETQLLLGQLAYQTGDLETASVELGKVADNEDAAPNRRMSANIFLARIAGQSGLIDEQFTLLETAAALTVAAESSTRLKLVSDRCFAYASHGRVDEARKLMVDFPSRSDAEELEQDSETRGALANLHLARSYMERVEGRFVAAEAFVRKSKVLFESVANDHGVASVLTSLTNVQRILGAFDEALKSSSQAAALFKKSGFVRAEATAWSIHGWTLLEAGKPLDARRVFASTLRLYAASMSWADQVSTAAGDALAAYRMGLNEEARALADECLNQADEGKSEQVRGWACYAAGIVLEREDLLLECATIWRKLGRPGWLMHTLTALITVPNIQNMGQLEAELHTLKKRLFAERTHG
ncbi:MAG TPA: hypothetical protein EYN06_00175, partial [Myxococcales bacterium]|nr:hypothetical protein [Myxococcales bacterium]